MAVWTIRTILDWTRNDFASRNMDSPRLDAELLIAHALGLQRIDLYIRFDQPLHSDELERIRGLVARRRKHEPVAYILQEKEFYGRPFTVRQGVLIPRPDTETLIETAVKLIKQFPATQPVHLLDIGSGSGAIAITLAAECPTILVDTVDISPIAVEITKENIVRHHVDQAVTVHLGSLYSPIAERRFHIITSNPPYIPRADIATLMPDVRDHEPHLALDGGPSGEDFYEQIIDASPSHLHSHGYIVFEVGIHQADRIANRLRTKGFTHIEITKDLAGIERVVSAQWL